MSEDSKTGPEDAIPEPIEVLIPGYTRKKIFRTWSEVLEFADAEKEAWTWLEEHKRLPAPLRNAANHQLGNLNNLQSWAQTLSANPQERGGDVENRCRSIIESYSDRNLVYSKSEDGQFICRLAESNPQEAVGALAGLIPENWQFDGAAWRPLLRGIAALFVNRVTIEHVEDAAASLDALRNDWSGRLDQQETAFKDVVRRFDNYGDEVETAQTRVRRFWLDQGHHAREFFRKSHADKAALETAFREHMRLEAPVEFWTKKATEHSRAAGIALLSFAILTASAAGVFVNNVESISKLISTENPFGSIVLVTIPALGFFWFLRFISRIFVTNLQRYQDARERATMVMTYLALLAEGENVASDQERALILHALFRPGPGDAPDDSPPANLLEILKQIGDRRGS